MVKKYQKRKEHEAEKAVKNYLLLCNRITAGVSMVHKPTVTGTVSGCTTSQVVNAQKVVQRKIVRHR